MDWILLPHQVCCSIEILDKIQGMVYNCLSTLLSHCFPIHLLYYFVCFDEPSSFVPRSKEFKRTTKLANRSQNFTFEIFRCKHWNVIVFSLSSFMRNFLISCSLGSLKIQMQHQALSSLPECRFVFPFLFTNNLYRFL